MGNCATVTVGTTPPPCAGSTPCTPGTQEECRGDEFYWDCFDGCWKKSARSCTSGVISPTYDAHGCNASIGETWCDVTQKCHIETTIPCRPILPVTPETPPETLPVYDIYGCNTSIGQTWCDATRNCHIESVDPCRPIVPVGGDIPPGVVTPETPLATGGCDGLNRGGNFDFTCLLEKQNQVMLILGIALIGGFMIMSTRK